MSIGQHLRIRIGTYFHHGIDVGDDSVVHYGNGIHNKANAEVEVVRLQDFAQTREIGVVRSPCRFKPEEIARRAKSRVGERCYDLFDNNCEHFANWCRSDIPRSTQIERVDVLTRQVATVSGKIALTACLKKHLSYSAKRLLLGPMLASQIAADTIQFGTELLAIRLDRTQAQSQLLGNTAGAVAATSLGLVCRGPAGALIGGTIWLTGRIAGEGANCISRGIFRGWKGN